jgi:hypothetical protein
MTITEIFLYSLEVEANTFQSNMIEISVYRSVLNVTAKVLGILFEQTT